MSSVQANQSSVRGLERTTFNVTSAVESKSINEDTEVIYQKGNKKIIKDFKPKQVVLDINGIGVFLADAMVRETYDSLTGELYPAYGFTNRDEYFSIQPLHIHLRL